MVGTAPDSRKMTMAAPLLAKLKKCKNVKSNGHMVLCPASNFIVVPCPA